MAHVEETVYSQPIPKVLIDLLNQTQGFRADCSMSRDIDKDFGATSHQYTIEPRQEPTDRIDVTPPQLNPLRRKVELSIDPGITVNGIDEQSYTVGSAAHLTISTPDGSHTTRRIDSQAYLQRVFVPGNTLQPPLPEGEYCVATFTFHPNDSKN